MINIEDENYLEQFDQLRFELNNYSESLLKKPYIIVSSKMDIEDSNMRFKKLKESLKQEISPISSVTKYGIKELLYAL